MSSKWQRDLEQAWLYRSALILCGNIRDLYPYGPDDEGPVELMELDDFLVRWAVRHARSIQVYDPIDRFRWALTDEVAPDTKVSGPADDPAAADEFSDSAPAPDSSADAASVTNDVARIAEYLTQGEGRCCIVQFADRVAAEKAGDEERRDALTALEKLIHDMRPGNRLLMVYLFAEDVPHELYVNEPRASIIEIPSPERRDVKDVLERRFGLHDEAVDRAVNSCHGFSLREIQRIADRLGGLQDVDALERAARLYKFGEQTNYWDELSLDKLAGAPAALRRDIKGQDEAIEKVAKVLVRARADIQRTTGGKPGRPRGVLFFAGPTGVGKTLTAQKLAEFVFGTRTESRSDSFLRFDMSEYSQEFQVSRLYGAPPGYVGFEQGGALTTPVQANPFRVILFDEFEKADARVYDIFLQILDDGRLTDSKGSVAHFSESIIICTSNIGADKESAARLREIAHDRELVRRHFIQEVEDFFRVKIGRPELLNRIGRDNIVVFNHIDSLDVAREIMRDTLSTVCRAFNKSYERRTPSLTLDLPVDDVTEALLAEDKERIEAFGGREVDNRVNERVRDELAMMVLRAEESKRPSARIRGVVDDGAFRLEFVAD